MSNTTNIPTGLNVQTQIPLNTIKFIQNESLLSNLGQSNNLAFKYYDGLIIKCIDQNKFYKWREVQIGEENTGIVNIDFTYPFNHSSFGINYSNKKFNFFPYYDEYNATNLGTGASVFKNKLLNIFNFRKIKTDNSGSLGESILKTEIEGTNDITISAKKIASKGTIIIETSVDGNTLYIDTPSTTSIAGLFVNNDYAPTYNDWLTENKVKNGGTAVSGFLFRGLGTMAQPFTNTRLYTLGSPLTAPTTIANTAISNALFGFLGGNARTNPLLSGQTIRVQKSTIPYTYSGDFSYSNLYLVLETDVNCTTTDWLVDMDNASYFNALISFCTIEIAENVNLNIPNSVGFRNSGTTDTTLPLYSTGRLCSLIGAGTVYSSYNGTNVLTQYILNGNGNVNNYGIHFQVGCKLRADYQGVYFTQNSQRIDFYNSIRSGLFLGSVNSELKAFHMTGGVVRFRNKNVILISGEPSGRTYGFTFEPLGLGVNNISFQLNSAKVEGTMQYCFAKLNNNYVEFLAFNSPSGDNFSTQNLGTTIIINGLFQNLGATKWSINFKNNVFSNTGIDLTKVDLTQGNNVSTSNFIGNNIIESLVTRNDRATAISSGLPIGSVFLNTGGVVSPTTGWKRDVVI